MDKELLINIIAQSKTKSETIKKLGLRAAGGNFQTLDKYIKLYNIDISHFEKPKDRVKKAILLNTIPLEDVLVTNCEYDRKLLKKRLYKTGLKKEICEMCEQGPIWKDKKISLILDHINGVWNDNRLENLRILCPNCNATLPTHCGKNVKKKEKQMDSKQKQITKRTDPRPERRKVVERPSKEELIAMIEKLGYCGVARLFGVSDNAVRKWTKSTLS